jgi:hypothetical protein
MVLSEQAMRAWKLGTAISTAFVGWFTLFEVDYTSSDHIQAYRRKHGDEDPHALAALQRYVRGVRDRLILGVDMPPPVSGNRTTNQGKQQEISESSESQNR